MNVRWERLSGNTSLFAAKIAFHDDPHRGLAADAETAASWGGLQLWVNGVNITAHIDQGETIQSAHWYLISVLEWMAENWDALLHEERLPTARPEVDRAADVVPVPPAWQDSGEGPEPFGSWESQFAWAQRHLLRSARDGGLFPGVALRRFHDSIEVSWSDAPLAGVEHVAYAAPAGVAYVEAELVANALFDVLKDASDWLLRAVPGSDRLAALHRRVMSLNADAHRRVRVAMLAGLGNTVDAAVERWTRLKEQVIATVGNSAASAAAFEIPQQSSQLVVTGSCEAALLFGSANPELTAEDALTLAQLLIDNYDTEPSRTIERFVRHEPPVAGVEPWESAYELAEQLHENLADSAEGLAVNVEDILRRLDVVQEKLDLNDRMTRAVSFASPNHRAVVALNANSFHYDSLESRRFTLAHELCHLLFDRDHGVRLAVASGPWAPRYVERRADAFAAMFLMPTDRLSRAIQESADGMATREGLTEVADRLGVSKSAVLEHAYNVGLIDDLRREELRDAIGR